MLKDIIFGVLFNLFLFFLGFFTGVAWVGKMLADYP